jgi:mannosyltransferase OCH1-like enzyme
MKMIPKIIHQIWSGIDEPLSEHFKMLGETWKEHHPAWKYEFWDNDRMWRFVKTYYPEHLDTYNSYPYNIQRWDAIRYLILDKIGGMYVDFDSECLEPHDELLAGKSCCFSMEPSEHGLRFNKQLYFNNALMACVSGHPFMKKVIEKVFNYMAQKNPLTYGQRIMEILSSTGPLALLEVYENYPDKDQIFLIPAKYVSPFTDLEIESISRGYESEDLEKRLQEAYSIHYFSNAWVNRRS